MKKTSVLILSLFLAQVCIARTDRGKVKAYYQWVNKAELALIRHDFKAASGSYRTAFKLKYPNGKDLYNAFQAAFYEEDSCRPGNTSTIWPLKGYARAILPTLRATILCINT